jgi:hypothetical protein
VTKYRVQNRTGLILPDTARRAIEREEGRPHWDRRPTLGYEEISAARGLPFEDGRVPMATLCEGKYAELDEQRFMRGEICVQCGHHLPECPSTPGAYKRILQADGFDIATRYPVFPGERLARERLAGGRCPICATEMSPDMARAMLAGEWDTREGGAAWNRTVRDS